MGVGVGLLCSTLAVGAGCGSAEQVSEAEAASPAEGHATQRAPEVLATERLHTRVAPHGKARVTPLVEGSEAFVAWLDLEAGAAVPPHRDETEESIVVIRGGGTLVMDGTTYELAAGDSVLMPAGVEVAYTNGPQPTRVLQVFAGPAPAAKYDSWMEAADGG